VSHPKLILDSLGAAARKSLSQNFLISPHWAEKLVGAAMEAPAEAIWEIGPGLGALTAVLLKQARVPVTAFEYDRKLSAYLRQTHPELDLVEGDVLDQDLETLSGGRKISVLSNLPYHLSSAILFKLAELPTPPVSLVLTFQREFAARVKAAPRTSDYGALSVVLQLQFHIKSLGVLPPGAFYPAPDVDSEGLQFTPVEKTVPPALRKLIRAAFQQRRKKLSSNLKSVIPSGQIPEIFSVLGINENARAEELSPQDYWKLGNQLGLFIA
jgi:16S rRNA (adenine1518-N6/adenine1519-N6)-dimethyltransferase